MSHPLLGRLIAVGLVLAAAIQGYIVAFQRQIHFRDFDIHREVGRRFLSGEYLYANDFCYAYLPTAGLYFAPLALMERNAGLALRYMVAVGCLAVTVFLFHRMVYGSEESNGESLLLAGGGAIILAFQFILQDLDDGGPHLILLAIVTGGIYAVWAGRERAGAVLFGLSIALKITPALFLLLFLWKRQWRMAIYTAVASIGWLVLPAVYMGPTNWWAHQTEWTQNAVSSLLDQQVEGRLVNEQRIRNQAIRPTLLRYLVTYPGSHPMRRDDPGYRPVLDLSPRVATGIVAALMLGILWCFAWASRESFQGPKDSAWPRDSAGLLLLTLLFSPMTWQQHLVWVVPAAFVVVASARSGGGMSKTEWMMMGAYIVLTMILNYEVLGREKFHVLMSYHPFGIAVLVLFGLVVLCSYRGRRTRAGSRLL